MFSMSSIAVYETETFAEHIARDINSDFQFIADRLPAEIKEGYAGETFTLASVEGVGVLWANYAGQRPDPTGRAIVQYMVQIGMLADGYESRLGFTKRYELSYQTLHSEGPLLDITHTTGADLEGCPAPLSALAFTVHSLREEFARMRGEELEHTDDVMHLDAFRVA